MDERRGARLQVLPNCLHPITDAMPLSTTITTVRAAPLYHPYIVYAEQRGPITHQLLPHDLPTSTDPPSETNPPTQKTWLVFGATGHMGRSVVKAALNHGDNVAAVGKTGAQRCSSSASWFTPAVSRSTARVMRS